MLPIYFLFSVENCPSSKLMSNTTEMNQSHFLDVFLPFLLWSLAFNSNKTEIIRTIGVDNFPKIEV